MCHRQRKRGKHPSTTSPLSTSKQRPRSSRRRRGLQKEARHKVWRVLSTPSCGKGGRHSIIASHTGFNMPEHSLCLFKKKIKPWKGMYNQFFRVPFHSSLLHLPRHLLFPVQCDLRNILHNGHLELFKGKNFPWPHQQIRWRPLLTAPIPVRKVPQ